MKTITTTEFRAQCGRIVNEVQRTREPVLITKRGRPYVKLIPVGRAKNIFGCLKGVIEIVGDIESPIIPAEDWTALND